MKKVFATLTVLAMITFGNVAVMAQDAAAPAQEEVKQEAPATDTAAVEAAPVAEEEARLQKQLTLRRLSLCTRC